MPDQRRKFSPGEELTILIDRLSVGGRGVGRCDGLVVFVPDVAPDEEVRVELRSVKKKFAEAKLLEVVRPSSHRRKPPCPVADRCGGCNWQHVEYGEQLKQKRLMISEALRRLAKLGVELEKIDEVVPSPRELRYRNRIRLHYAEGRLGFFQRGSNEIVDIDDCLIADEKIAQEIPSLKKKMCGGDAQEIEVRLNLSKSVEFFKRASVSASAAFAQVNTLQNENLHSYVVELIRNAVSNMPRPLIFDLYAGAGNFSFPISAALREARIIAVELNRENVNKARARLGNEFVGHNVDFRNQDVADFLMNENPSQENLVCLDPPRIGCEPRVLQQIVRLYPAKIVYVSCNPVTLARDLREICSGNYRISRIRPFDMFPQTDHVESVVLLERTGPTSSR